MDPDGQVEREGVFSLHVLRKDAQSILNVSIYICYVYVNICMSICLSMVFPAKCPIKHVDSNTRSSRQPP